jgi:hypothetical protein
MFCPECGAKVDSSEVRNPYFTCRVCACKICVSRGYWLKVRLVTAFGAFIVCYLLGLRGVSLLLAWGVSSPILGIIAIAVSQKTIPPTVERYFHDGSLGLWAVSIYTAKTRASKVSSPPRRHCDRLRS